MRSYTTAAMCVLTAVAIIVTLAAPGLGVGAAGWFIAGVVALVAAAAFALATNPRPALWRFDWAVAALGFVAIGLLRAGAGASGALFAYLAVLPALVFATDSRVRSLAFTVLGCFVALFLPILVGGVPASGAELWGAVVATVVITTVAVLFHQVTRRSSPPAANTAVANTAAANTAVLDSSAGPDPDTLRAIWNATTEQAIIGTDLAGRIDAFNPGAERMLRLRADDAVHTLNVVDFHVRSQLESRAGAEKIAAENLTIDQCFVALAGSASHAEPAIAEWTYVRRDGSQLDVRVSVTQRLDGSGTPIGYLFVAIDQTEARKVAKLQDEYIHLISHELRTPLSSILGYLELMREEDGEPLSGTQLSYLRVAERNAHRLLGLVGDLVFTAKVESGTLRLEVAPLELTPIVQASVDAAKSTAATAGVTLTWDIAADIVVDGDAPRLGQVVDNLVANALKLTPRGGTVTVSLSAARTEAVLSVTDPAARPTSPKDVAPGAGLELTISKAIVSAHHGVMSVDDVDGDGALLTVRLPLAAQPVVTAV